MRSAVVSSLILTLVAVPVESQVITRIERPVRTGLVLTFLQGLNPKAAQQGQKNVSVSLTGVNTHFSQGTTAADFGAGITLASPLTITSPTTLTAVLNIDPTAAAGYRNVTVTTGAESVALANGFGVALQPDAFGKSCGSATELGTLFPGASKTASGWQSLSGNEWLAVSFVTGASLTVSLQGVQSPSDFDLVAYSVCGNQIAATSAGSKSLNFPDTGPHRVILEVRPTAWDYAKSNYTILLTAH